MPATFSLSLAHATMLDVPPPQLVRIAAAAGYEAVGFRLIPFNRPGEHRHALAENPTYFKDIKRSLAETGVRLLDVEVALVKDGVAPESYRPTLDAVAELGGQYVLVNVYVADGTAKEDGLAALAGVARPLGLTLALEPVTFSDVPTLSEAIDLVTTIDDANVGLLIDVMHFHTARSPLSDLDRVLPGRLHYVHISDAPAAVPATLDGLRELAREHRLLPGEGGIDIAGILKRLPRDLTYAIESQNPARSAALGAEAYARLAFEQTTRYLERHVTPR